MLVTAGLSTRGIANQLFANGIVNPENGASYSHETIASDIREIRKQWRANAQAEIADLVATQNARVEALITSLWSRRTEARTAEVILQAINQQMRLLGTDKPTKLEVSGKDGGAIEIKAIDYHEAIAALEPDDIAGHKA